MTMNSSMAPVSVIIPCFRCSDTIERAIDSIVYQTLRPEEVILVDDLSSDGTLDVLKNLEKKFEGWIKVITLNAHQGAASARNEGWTKATQPFIAFLDADDAWHSRKIEIQYTYMSKHEDVLLCGHECKLLKISNKLPNWGVDRWNVKDISILILLLSNQFTTPSVMLRRSIPERFNPSQRHMEDHRLWLDITFRGGRAAKLSATLAAIYKPAFGTSGLSSQLWLMEKSDLANISYFFDVGYVNRFQCSFLKLYSLMKFVRRLLITWTFLRWVK